MSLQQNVKLVRNSFGSTAFKQNQRREASGKIIRSILFNKDAHQSQLSFAVHSEQKNLASNRDKDNRPLAQIQFLKDTNAAPQTAGHDLCGFSSEMQEKQTRNKNRPDLGVWNPLRRSDESHVSDESLSSSASQSTHLQEVSVEGSHGEVKIDMLNARSWEVKTVGSGRSSYPPLENSSHTPSVRMGIAHQMKDDGSFIISEGKPLRKGSSSGCVPHEKQKWVQKSSAGS